MGFNILIDKKLLFMDLELERENTFSWLLENDMREKDEENYLVSVHSFIIKDPGPHYNPDIAKKIEKIEGLFGPEKLYFTPIDPIEMPLNEYKQGLPGPDEIENLYLIGCYLGACIDSQVCVLKKMGYGKKIEIVEDLVI